MKENMKMGMRKQIGAAAASPCAACKLLRRRCAAQECVFAPYFPADEPHKFASVHKVFGASNVNKMLQFRRHYHYPLDRKRYMQSAQCFLFANRNGNFCFYYTIRETPKELPVHQRGDAVSSLVYEANARVRDPVYGCVGAISSLQRQVDALQTQLALAQAEVVHMRMRSMPSITATNSPENGSISQAKSLFTNMDMVVDEANIGGESLWSC